MEYFWYLFDLQDIDADSITSDHERFLRYLLAREDIPYADQKVSVSSNELVIIYPILQFIQ